jgi:ribosomal RNA assembly protein
MDSDILRVPKERVAVIIGTKGSTKQKIEKKTGVKLKIDSKSGEIQVIAKEGHAEKGFKAMQIVKAIARGFSPEHALMLLHEGFYLDMLDLGAEISSEKELAQKRGRVIGKRGTSRKAIEQSTGALVSVYGKTIAIIGGEEEIEKARKAIEMLLEGASHKTVFDYLERNKRKRFEL